MKGASVPSLALLLGLACASTACGEGPSVDDDGSTDGDGDGGDGDGGDGDGDLLPGTGGADGAGGTGGDGDGDGGPSGGVGGTDPLPPRDPGMPILPNGRGASVHFVTYEAEDASYTGELLGPSRTFTEVASEASGRRAVRLSGTGSAVTFTTQGSTNSIVVRYSIPDGGQDYWTTLTVLVDGVPRTKLDVTSRYSWTYGDEGMANQPGQESPASGIPHHFFDEARALIGDVAAGQTITITKAAGDDAAHYDIDFIELENVPPPLPMPSGYLSIESCGATPNDGSDDSNAILACITQAENEGRGLFIPEGVFHSYTKTLSVPGLTIVGAGMWYSVISGFHARFDCYEPTCSYRDFAVFGDTVLRDDDSPETAFGGTGSSGAVLDHIWVEHTKVGYWTGANTNGLVIRNSRFRNLMADAVNLYGGASNCLVEENHSRNTGDDAFAAWSHDIHAENHDNIFRSNYVQLPWKANCFGIYGGSDTVIDNNVCVDVVQYPGILLANQFDSRPFGGTTTISKNTLIRTGGHAFDSDHGAFKIHAAQGPVRGVSVTDLDILSPTYSAFHIQGQDFVDTVYLDGVNVESPGTSVFHLNWGSEGALDASNIVATGAPNGVIDDSDGEFAILRGTGNSGW